jgi:cobalt-zinc-cadmium efflux system protein
MHVHGNPGSRTRSVLTFSLGATLVYIAVLVVAGIRAHSLALLSEAGHNLSDFIALLLSWVAVVVANRPANSTKTYGYHRAGVLAAFVNAASLVAIALFIFYEAVQRFRSPQPVRAGMMMAVAAVGVVMNGAITLLLFRSNRDVNIRSALIHEIGDTLSTAAVIIGGLVIMVTGQVWVDPALSFAIGLMILWSSFGIIRETLNILLEGTPRGVKLEEISAEIMSSEGVCEVHDLHVWSIGSETHALSCHIRIADIPPSESDRILREVNDRLLQRFHIHHTTVQFEHTPCEVAHGCVMPVAEAQAHPGHSH